jgi:tetratricopeptide (TPR) repeat protein
MVQESVKTSATSRYSTDRIRSFDLLERQVGDAIWWGGGHLERSHLSRCLAKVKISFLVPRLLFHARTWIFGLLLSALAAPALTVEAPAAVARPLEQAVAAAESSLRAGQNQRAEGHYRTALVEGWLVLGSLSALEDDVPAARAAHRNAAVSAADDARALRALALLDLRTGDTEQAIEALARLARQRPDDLELLFLLAGAYLQVKKADLAQELFVRLVKERPIPQTHVLVGRAYRDAGEHARARAQLEEALRKDPRVRRAHYYLGMVALREKGRAGVEEAIREFRAELQNAPQDPLASLELGIALVSSQQYLEALPVLEVAARAHPADTRTLAYLGRAQLGADRAAEAASSLARALDLAVAQGANAAALRGIHLPLAQALRTLGRADEAARHFAEAKRLSAEGTASEREQLAEYLADGGPGDAGPPAPPVVQDPALLTLSPAQRSELRGRVTAALTRVYLNLGVLQAQAERFAQAAELFEQASALSPDFPQVQSSLGVAYFNAREFAKATGPLTRAVAAGTPDPQLKRMLALAWLNTENYEKAAELLRDDPERARNPSLQFAYGMSLVRLERPAEAEEIFHALLSAHGDSAELSVLLGQAHAQQGDFDAAVVALQRAISLKKDVAEAHANLGIIYLRQGKFAEAELAFRAELAAHPDDLRSQQNLAIVLDSLDRGGEAVPLLRAVLRAKPDYPNTRYLLGKILLALGQATEALEHLEAATRLAPEDAPARYQLGQAYQKLGRTEEARAQFEVFRQLKAKR